MHWPFLVSEVVLTVSSLLPEATSTSWPHTPCPSETFVIQCSSLICLQRRSLWSALVASKKKNHFRIKFLPNLFLTLSFLLTILWHCTGFWEVPISYFTCSSLSSVSRYGRFTCEETEIFRGPVNWPGAPRWQMIEKWLSARVPVA